ncbi:MAG: nucleoside deaminase [Actinomycetota bacterium]
MTAFPGVAIELPLWVAGLCATGQIFPTVEDRMDLTLALVRGNLDHATGGPFGAAIFSAGGALVAPGVNLVAPLHFAGAHAELVAIGIAGQIVGNFDLGVEPTEMFASTEPCAMCLGAVPWSGVQRLVCGARDEDASAIGFEEGDKPADWVSCLNQRGIEVIRDVKRMEATTLLREYAAGGGLIYNGRTRTR